MNETENTVGEMIDVVVGRIGCTRPQVLYMLEAISIAFKQGFLEGLKPK